MTQPVNNIKLMAPTVIGAALIVGAAAWAIAGLRGIREPLILHYSSYTGINRIGSLYELLGLLGLGGLIVAVNATLSLALKERHALLSEYVAATSLAIAALLFIACIAIISVNR